MCIDDDTDNLSSSETKIAAKLGLTRASMVPTEIKLNSMTALSEESAVLQSQRTLDECV